MKRLSKLASETLKILLENICEFEKASLNSDYSILLSEYVENCANYLLNHPTHILPILNKIAYDRSPLLTAVLLPILVQRKEIVISNRNVAAFEREEYMQNNNILEQFKHIKLKFSSSDSKFARHQELFSPLP